MLFIDSGGLNISNRKLFALLAGLHSSCRYILIKSLKEDYDILLRLPCSSREYGHLKSFPVFQKKDIILQKWIKLLCHFLANFSKNFVVYTCNTISIKSMLFYTKNFTSFILELDYQYLSHQKIIVN